MLVRTLIVGSVASLATLCSLGLAPSAPLATSAGVTADSYTVDPVHSTMIFRIKHNNVAYFYGRFNEVTGTISFDPASEGASSLDLSVKTDSVDAGNEKRTGHLKSADF